MDTSQFMEELATECKNRNVSPQDLVDYVIEAKEGFKITKRGLGRAAAILGAGALVATGTASAAPTDQGQVSANSIMVEKIEGPSDTTVVDMANDIVDLQNTNRMVLPLYAGTNPSTVVGDFYYDTTSD